MSSIENLSSENQLLVQSLILQINNTITLSALNNDTKVNIFGKNGLFTEFSKKLNTLPNDQKKSFGMELNIMKNILNDAFENRYKILENREFEELIAKDKFDGTIPCREKEEGSVHILTQVSNELLSIMKKYGFEYVRGPEIEKDYYNFEALNFPKNHPARQMQDTFYLNKKEEKNGSNKNLLLRTHTTCVDLRYIIENKVTAPFAITSLGKVFRSDSDKTHNQMFHQMEGLMVDEHINMSHLKYFLESLLSDFFETKNVVIKFRPSFFPFTEPSAEVDVGYSIVDGKIVIGGSDHFLEILGCGMLHPNVMKNLNIDSKSYQAIAFGCGVERMAMLKYGITDLREFTNSKINWLNHYKAFL